MLSKNIRSVHKKLIRLMKSDDIVKMEFPEFSFTYKGRDTATIV